MEDEENKRFISVLSDYGFKIIFADENDTYSLRRALKALVQGEESIKEVQFLRNEFAATSQDSRGGLYDLICEDEKGNIFIVEMQLWPYKNYIQRAKFYAFQKFNTFVRKGKYKYKNLPQMYCIGFLAKNIYPNLDTYYHYATLKNQFGEELDHQTAHIIVEISKFDKAEEEIESDLEKLIFFMKHLDKYQGKEDLPIFMREDWLERMTEKLDRSAMTPDQIMNLEITLAQTAARREGFLAEREEMIQETLAEREEMIQETLVEMEEMKQEKLVEMEEMKQEKLREMEEELEQVRLQKEKEVDRQMEDKLAQVKRAVGEQMKEQVNEEIAKKLKASGVDYEVISKSTGLSIDEIQSL